MKRILLCFSLLGCGTNNTNPAAPESCSTIAPSGICIGADSDVTQPWLASALEFNYRYTATCMTEKLGVEYRPDPAPVVRLVSQPINGRSGWTSWDTGQITLQGTALINHESIHYLLWRSGYPNDRNEAHDHPAFEKCDPLWPNSAN